MRYSGATRRSPAFCWRTVRSGPSSTDLAAALAARFGCTSCNAPEPGGDWLGCAQALVAHGMPMATPDPASAGTVLISGERKQFSDEVRDFLLGTAPGG